MPSVEPSKSKRSPARAPVSAAACQSSSWPRGRGMASGQPQATSLVRLGAFGLVLLYAALAIGDALLSVLNSGLTVGALVPILLAVYPLIGALILVRLGNHAVGWILAAVGSLLLLLPGIDEYAAASLGRNHLLPGGALALAIQPLAWGTGIYLVAVGLPLVFPTGRLLSRRWISVIALGL